MLVAYDTKLLTEWDHTAVIAAGIYNLTCVVVSAASKAKPRPRPPLYFHPYRQEYKPPGLRITQQNFTDLRTIVSYARG